MENCNHFYQSTTFIVLIIVLVVFDTILKLFAMWKAARLDRKLDFFMLAFINSAGIFPIIYLLWKKKSKEN